MCRAAGLKQRWATWWKQRRGERNTCLFVNTWGRKCSPINPTTPRVRARRGKQRESCLLNSDGNVRIWRMMQQVGYLRTNTNNSILGRCDTGTNGSGKIGNWQRYIINRGEGGIYINASVKGWESFRTALMRIQFRDEVSQWQGAQTWNRRESRNVILRRQLLVTDAIGTHTQQTVFSDITRNTTKLR